MIVCVCTGIGDKQIRSLARKGSTQVPDVARRCGAGTCCGACIPTIQAVVADELENIRREASSEEQAHDLGLIAEPATA